MRLKLMNSSQPPIIYGKNIPSLGGGLVCLALRTTHYICFTHYESHVILAHFWTCPLFFSRNGFEIRTCRHVSRVVSNYAGE